MSNPEHGPGASVVWASYAGLETPQERKYSLHYLYKTYTNIKKYIYGIKGIHVLHIYAKFNDCKKEKTKIIKK